MAVITQEQFRTSSQSIQSRYVRIEILNYNFSIVDEISGVAIGGTLSYDANSDIRRTGNIEIAITNSSFEVGSGNRIWLDKYVRIWCGTYGLLSGEIEWTNCGIYLIDAPSYSYDPSTNILNMSLLDLMAKLTGVRNGYLQGVPILISAGENIRSTIIDTLALGGFTKYVVEEAPSPSVVPNDLNFSQGSTVYDVLSGLRDIYPNYEMFFDVDGVFYYKPIPTGQDEGVVADDALFEQIVLSEDIDTDFQNVKNSIEVYGRIHDPAHYSGTTTVSDSTITLSIEDVTEYQEDVIYGFSYNHGSTVSNAQLKINTLSTLPLKDDSGNNVQLYGVTKEEYLCVQYKGTYWHYLGHLQAYGFAEDDNPDSPFYVEGSVGRIRLPLYDGDYANCLTDKLAQERAEYELWLHTNMNNSVTLSCVPVFWLDVNQVVEYTLQRNGTKNKYLIKSINIGLGVGDNMTINMVQIYE